MNYSVRHLIRPIAIAAVGIALTTMLGPITQQPAFAQQDEDQVPGAPRMLPQDTLAYLRIDNVDELRSEFGNASIGRMLADPEIRPFASDVYATLAELFAEFASATEMSLDEILAIPQGQVAVALMPGNLSDREEETVEETGAEDDESDEAIRRRIARKRRQQNSFAGFFLVDAGENVDDLMSLVKKLEAQITKDGYVRRTTKIGDTTLVRLLPPRPGRPDVEYFQRSGTVIFGIGHDTASKALQHWDDASDDPTLADSADFGAVMARCVGAESTRPQLTFYVDPYHIVERIVKRNASAGLVWPLVEQLGIGKIRGIGGSSFTGGEVFEGITHFHVLVDPPRDGLFGVLRPETGDSTPPTWVPNDVTSYTSIYWDFDKTYENLEKIVAMFQGPDPFQRNIEEPAKSQFNIDLREDIVKNLSGRYVTLRWIEPPIRLNSATQLHAVEVNDPVRMKQILSDLRAKRPGSMRVESIAGESVYLPPAPPRDNFPKSFRRPEPCAVILGNWVIGSDSRAFLEKVIRTANGSQPNLMTVPEYELVISELGGKLDGEDPFMVSFLRGADYISQMYNLVKSPDTRRFIRAAGENNPVAAKFSEMLERNELPPFEKLRKYFAPSGTFAYDEPSGIHIGSFTLRSDQ